MITPTALAMLGVPGEASMQNVYISGKRAQITRKLKGGKAAEQEREAQLLQ